MSDDIYETMLENFEMWYVYSSGSAVLISDASLLDS